MIVAKAEIGGEELVHGVAPRWERLCEETRSAPFQRPEWIIAYLRAFEPHSEVVLMTASIKDKLVAVLPMIRKRCWFAGVPVWKLAGAANVHSVRFDILRTTCQAGEDSIPLLWGLLKCTPGWHVLELPVFPENGACQKMITRASTDGYPTITALFQESPILRMQADEKGQLNWLQGTSRHFRHELRRFARLLAEETGDEPKLVRRSSLDPHILEQFYRLEASGWKGKEGSAINCAPDTRAFYDQIAKEASTRGYFCLHTLECTGGIVAGAFSVETEGCFYPMKIAYNEELRRGGPGQLLFSGIFQECAAKGIPELFFGGNKDRYKTSWTADTLPHYNGFIFGRSFRSRLAHKSRTSLLPRLGRLRRHIRSKIASAGKPQVSETEKGSGTKLVGSNE